MSETEKTSKEYKVNEVLEMVDSMTETEAVAFIKDDDRKTVELKLAELLNEELDTKELRSERFNRVAVKRGQSVIDRLAILGKITQNPQNYEFSAKEIDQIFNKIDAFSVDLRKRFYDCLSISETKDEYKISLDEEYEEIEL